MVWHAYSPGARVGNGVGASDVVSNTCVGVGIALDGSGSAVMSVSEIVKLKVSFYDTF